MDQNLVSFHFRDFLDFSVQSLENVFFKEFWKMIAFSSKQIKNMSIIKIVLSKAKSQ